MSKTQKLIVANWKMNKNIVQMDDFLNNFPNNSSVIICPPFTLLANMAKKYKNLGGQDCSAFAINEGAFTGDISAQMLKDLGCTYVILGHCERRKYHNESNVIIQKKIINAMQADLKVILCIGETLEQREKQDYKQILLSEIKNCLPGTEDIKNIIFAYEPVWAIGTGRAAKIEEIDETHKYLSEKITSEFAFTPKIIYGGSVNLDNAQPILNLNNVDGMLIGGASLEPSILHKIEQIAKKVDLCN